MSFHRITKKSLLCRNCYVISIAFFFIVQPLRVHSQTSGSSLEKALLSLEQQYGVSISYNADLLKKIRLEDDDIKGLSLEAALVKFFRNTSWQFEMVGDNYIVISEMEPDFLTKYRQSYCGKIRSADTKEPLLYANVRVNHTDIGTSSFEGGLFQIEAPLVSTDSILISYLGYQSVLLPASYFEKGNCPTVLLQTASRTLEPVLVEIPEKELIFAAPESLSSSLFNLQKIDFLGGQVERDAFQVLQLLPGITDVQESPADMHIRGGVNGQNLVLYDGMTLYHFGHFFGKVAAVNPSFSEEVALFKEGVSAQYGGRVAGVVDIKSKSNIPSRIGIEAALNALSGNLSVHAPVLKRKGHLLVAYRRSLTDIFESGYFKKVFDQIFQNSRITSDRVYVKEDSIEDISSLIPVTQFYDLNVKLNFQSGKNTQWDISYANMEDALYYNYIEGDWYQSVDTLQVNNVGLSVGGKHRWNEKNFLEGRCSYSGLRSRYEYAANLLDTIVDTRYGDHNEIDDFSFKINNHWEGDKQILDVGYQYNLIREGHGIYVVAPWENPNRFWTDSIQGQTHALYLDYRFRVPKVVQFNLGLRSSYYDLTRKIYQEPRFFVKVFPKPHWTLKVASGIYYQTINQLIEHNELNSNSKLWVLAKNTNQEGRASFSVVRNTQFSVGLNYHQLGWDASVAYYQKAVSGITSRTVDFNSEFPLLTGNMNARGIEFSLQRKNDFYTGLISYTLSESIYEFEYYEYPFPANYDQRHSLKWMQAFHYKNITLSSMLNWHTGTPYAGGVYKVIDLTDPNDPSYWLEFDRFNGHRLPFYMRWDISLIWNFKIKKVKGQVVLAGLNLLNRRNILQRNYILNYAEENTPPHISEVNKYGIPFTPNVGVSFQF